MPDIVLAAVGYVAAGGGIYLINFIFFFFLYVTVRYLGFVFTKKTTTLVGQHVSEEEKVFRASLLLIGALMVALFFLGIVVDRVNHSPEPATVIKNSFILMESERAMFGVYPQIWLHQSGNQLKHYLDIVSPSIVNIYGQLGILISLLFLLALLWNEKMLFRVVIAFALSIVVSVPFWVAFPAVTPNEAYYSNKLHAEIPASIAHEFETFSPTPKMAKIFQYIADNRDTGINGYYGITTIPSMHITWAVFVLYYGILLYRKFAIYLVPYFILNAFSTVYLLQHFTLDIVAGIAMGVGLIFVVERATWQTPPMLELVGASMRADVEYFMKRLELIYAKLWR